MNKKFKKIRKCKWCGKDFLSYKCQNRKFCSNKCKYKYFKKHKIGTFFNPQLQKSNGKKSLETQKRLKIGIFDPKLQSKIQKRLKKEKKGIYNPKVRTKAGKIGGKIGGLVSAKVRREKKPYYFHKIPFDSNFEREIGMNISYQLNIKLKEGLNCHVIVGGKEIDFFIKDCFIEPHSINHFFNKYYKNDKDYYLKRRKILDENGYKKYKLIVIT